MKKYLAVYYLLANSNKRDLKKYTFEDAEKDYKKAISKHSQIYLDTSWWYVGDSLLEYKKKTEYDFSKLGILGAIKMYNWGVKKK